MEDKQSFEDWKEEVNSWGDLDQDYFNYVGAYIENEEGSAEDMLTFDEFAQREYDKFLLEVHKEDELDDPEDPFPGEDEA